MKRYVCLIFSLLLVLVLCAPAFAEEITSPYVPVDGGCITGVEMLSYENMPGGIDYFTATVTSHIQGLEERAAIPYLTFGAIGSENSKMFVYSVGDESDLNYSRATVKEIVERFEAENPAWDAVVAVNGDFFDIETSKTPDMGEPEGSAIQQGEIYKSLKYFLLGRGLVGTTDDGEMIYYTSGKAYRDNGYGTQYNTADHYQIQVLGDSRNNSVMSYQAYSDREIKDERLSIVSPTSRVEDLSGQSVCVVKCDTYRRAHIGINGNEAGTVSYFFEGEIVEVRSGGEREKPEEGYMLIGVPDTEKYSLLTEGAYLRVQLPLEGDWERVTNAISFKQQILAEGTVLLKNAYGTYNTSGDKSETEKWSDDVYDYPHCWKDRVAIGFREDDTPAVLLLKKSSHPDTYKNLGASYYEIGEQLKSLGCVNGFLLDGGGSSTFVVRNEEGGFDNAHVGEGDGRAVANAVILAVRDESVELPTVDPVIGEGELIEPEPTKPASTKKPKVTDENITDTATDTDGAQPSESGCGSQISPAVIGSVILLLPALCVTKRRKRS